MENTDRELLELAANATCLEWKWVKCPNYDDFEVPGMHLFDNINETSYWYAWNPLDNDGDAFRLAHKLNIAVTQYPIYTSPKHSVLAKVPSLDAPRAEALELHGEDKLQATRRAIVRCAAEIGRAMKE